MRPPSRVRTSSLVRGGGVALACLMPGLPHRTRAVLASYGVGWPLGKPGLQLFVVVPDHEAPDWQRAVLPFATSAASWTAAMTAAATLARRAPVPVALAAVLLGGAVAVGDSALVDLGERLRTRVTVLADPAPIDTHHA